MSEPPLPTIPTGQSRDFNLTLPEMPAPDGPGADADPDCQPELLSLVADLNASPSQETTDAFVSFVEQHTGQSIEELVPAWNDVITDGTEREASFECCGATVTITISGTLITSATCSHLPTYGISFPQTDFDLPCVRTETFGRNLSDNKIMPNYDSLPDITVHLEQPETLYLNTTDHGALLTHLSAFEYMPTRFGAVASGGKQHYYLMKIKGSFTCKIAHTRNDLYHYNSATDSYFVFSRSYRYHTEFPIMGFHNFLRYADGVKTDGASYEFRALSEPIRTGTISGSVPPFGVQNTDLPNSLNEDNYAGHENAEQADRDYSADRCYFPPIHAEGPANNYFKFLRFDSQSRTSDTLAWSEFLNTISDYQATATSIYDADVTLDAANMKVTVSFDTDSNCMYLPLQPCGADAPVTALDGEGTPYNSWAVSWGPYWYDTGWGTPGQGVRFEGSVFQGAGDFSSAYIPESGVVFPKYLQLLNLRIIRDYPEDNTGYFVTDFRRVLSLEAGEYLPEIEAAVTDIPDTTPPGGSEPPSPSPNPPVTPLGGGCRSYLGGPSSCNWNVPVPASPQPEVPSTGAPIPPLPNFPMPKDNFPDVPVVDTHLPNLPNLPCTVPDFGNFDPCGKGTKHPNGSSGGGSGGGGGPGYMGSVPGGRDWQGRRGSAGTVAGIKTAGQTYAARSYLFTETTCPGITTPGIGCMAVITQLLMDCGINPVDIIFQIGPEWDKPFPADKCFVIGSGIFDAAMWTARFIMCTIVDEGPPTNDVYIGPPWHRPLQTTWIFNEHYDLFSLSRGMSSEESYGWVEVFGPNVTTPVIVRIDDPFSTEDEPTLRVEVAANFTQGDAEDLGAYRAAEVRREAVSVQAVVPYSSEYFLRDLMLLQAPDRGFQETYVITGKESDVSGAGWFHVLTGMLPATLAELDAFPEVTDEYSAIEGGFV